MKAVVRGRDLPISERHAAIVCKAIKNQSLEYSTKLMDDIVNQRMGVKKEGGRVKVTSHGAKYPLVVAKVFSKMLKSLSANASVKGMDPKTIVIFAKADKASRPQRPGNRYRKFKRAHVTLEGRSAKKEEKAPVKKEEKK